jgi:hypothetical protein
VFAAAAVVAAASSQPRAQGVQEAPAIQVPTTELRLVGGTGVGAEAAQSLLGHRLRLDAGLRAGPGGGQGEGAALVRVLGSAANGVWLRGGFMYQRVDIGCGVTDKAASWDAGLAYRKRWAGGSLFAAETGVETVSRASGVYCNDSVLRADSGGVRFSVGGQYALTRGLGLYGPRRRAHRPARPRDRRDAGDLARRRLRAVSYGHQLASIARTINPSYSLGGQAT